MSRYRMRAIRVLTATTVLAVTVSTADAQGTTGFQVTFLGHAAFQVQSPAGTMILIDPFLSQNPQTPTGRRDLTQYNPDAILVTHSHLDHALDAAAIATTSGAQIIASVEHVTTFDVPTAQQGGGNVGGTFTVGDVTITLVPAMHSSDPGGRPLGFILEAPGAPTLYHTGDTWIFGDMALIQELYAPSVLLLQAGGGPFNQDPATARLTVTKYFTTATAIVPMHFGTFASLATETDVRTAFTGEARLTIMTPGQTTTFTTPVP